jgi:hypothetical protein
MKSTYRVRIEPQRYYGLISHQVPELSVESLSRALAGVVVREISSGDYADYFVDVQLQRESHEQALNEILVTVQNLGYSWLEGTVTEWADQTIAGALAGGGVGGIAGGETAGPVGALVFGLLGALVCAAVGSFIESHKVIYTAHWTAHGWLLTPQTPSEAPGLQPGFA